LPPSSPARFILFLSLSLALTLAGLGRPLPASGAPEMPHWPKRAQYVCKVGDMTSAQLDTLSRYDLVVLSVGPNTVQELRRRDPGIELFFAWMPQNIVNWSEGSTAWYPDTTWSLIRLAQFYAIQNDWFLYDVNGNRIAEWDGWASNWTRYCPKGTYGTSRGLNYAEWLTQVAIPRMVSGNSAWQPWGPGSSAYDGLMMEVLVDCVGSWGNPAYAIADPDRDGLPEGVDDGCTGGGDQDSLSILYREMNETFHEATSWCQDQGIPVLNNTGNVFMGPSWRTDFSGVKIEGWLSWSDQWFQDWWDWFYGLRDPTNTAMWGPGYKWAETFVNHHGVDAEEGWDRSLLEVRPKPGTSPSTCQRLKRWGLGTTLLGNGYFIYTMDECGLFWQPELDWDFGQPLGEHWREVHSGRTATDTLYVRQFENGFVEVNPNAFVVSGVPAQDSRFGFWQTIEDLSAEAVAPDSVVIAFTAPPPGPSEVESLELRYAQAPITPENWDEALPCSAEPLVPRPGERMELRLGGLDEDTAYYFAARNRVHGRQEPGLSNLATVTTPQIPRDEIPPAMISDLRADRVDSVSTTLVWTATGDDGFSGAAALYDARVSRSPLSEDAWDSAESLDGEPEPSVSGRTDTLDVAGLQPGTTYYFALRAIDEEGNASAWSNVLGLATLEETGPPDPPPPDVDSLPPAPVLDLTLLEVHPGTLTLAWTAPGDDGDEGRAASYDVRFASTEEEIRRWEDANEAGGEPSPAMAGSAETMRIAGLPPATTIFLGLRTTDDAGLVSDLSNLVTATMPDTAPLPPEDPDRTPPDAVDDLTVVAAGSTWITLRWTAPGDDGSAGTAALYDLRFDQRTFGISDWPYLRRAKDEPVPSPGGTHDSLVVSGLLPGTRYFFALRAADEAVNWSALSVVADGVTATAPDSSGPDPDDPDDPGDPDDPDDPDDPGDPDDPDDPTDPDDPDDPDDPTDPDDPGDPDDPDSDDPGNSHSQPPPAPPGRLTVEPGERASLLLLRWNAPPEPVVGYFVLGQSPGAGWERLHEEPLTVTWWTLDLDRHPALVKVAVIAVDSAGRTSERSAELALSSSAWVIEGPYPHPIVDECIVRVATPPDYPVSAPLRVAILDLRGGSVGEVYRGPVRPATVYSWTWERRAGGSRPAPGFYYLLTEGGGHKEVRPIVLSP